MPMVLQQEVLSNIFIRFNNSQQAATLCVAACWLLLTLLLFYNHNFRGFNQCRNRVSYFQT